MSRTYSNKTTNDGKPAIFAGKHPEEENPDQKGKTGKKGRKGGAVLGEINDEPKKKKPN
jgi:hypothetical protein